MDEYLDLARYVLAEFLVYFEAYWQILALFVLVHLLLALVLSRRKREKKDQELTPDFAAPRQKQRKKPNPELAPVAPTIESQSYGSETLMAVFKNDLYQIEEVLYQGRFGVDFVASREGRRTLVNGKWWKKKVNDNAVLSISEARTYYRCDFVLLVSERGFTRAARKAASDHNVILWDQRQLQQESNRSRSGNLKQVEVAAGADGISDK